MDISTINSIGIADSCFHNKCWLIIILAFSFIATSFSKRLLSKNDAWASNLCLSNRGEHDIWNNGWSKEVPYIYLKTYVHHSLWWYNFFLAAWIHLFWLNIDLESPSCGDDCLVGNQPWKPISNTIKLAGGSIPHVAMDMYPYIPQIWPMFHSHRIHTLFEYYLPKIWPKIFPRCVSCMTF